MIEHDRIRDAMRLYAVTDETWIAGRTLEGCVEEALAGGATFVQLRDKNSERHRLRDSACRIKALCEAAGVPFVINDDVGLAREIDADGVHVGQDDMACKEARATLGPAKIVGVSVQTREQAFKAQEEGADYLGVGAVFSTATKPDSALVSREALRGICKAVTIPVVAIGGLNEKTIPLLAGTGVDGVAVVSALFAAEDVRDAASRLRSLVDEIVP